MIEWPVHYSFPIVSALLFALASMLLKRSLDLGAGATRALYVTNIVFFLYFLPFLPTSTADIPLELLWVPIVAGVIALFGALFSVLALKYGDVSVATPLLGSKILFVALLSSWILGEPVPLSWWVGAIMAMLAIGLLGYAPVGKRRAMALTVVLSLASALSFAFMDILFAGWAKTFGFFRFAAIQQVILLLCSLPLVFFFQGPLRRIPKPAWKWIILHAILMCTQFFILNWTISQHGEPTAINILYSTRGLWSVLMVWAIGHYLMSVERRAGKAAFLRRTGGAILLLAAVTMVLVGQ